MLSSRMNMNRHLMNVIGAILSDSKYVPSEPAQKRVRYTRNAYIPLTEQCISQPGKVYHSPDHKRVSERRARRCGEETARQQRKRIKVARAEAKAEAKLDREIANHNASLAWQDEMQEEREHYEYHQYDDVA